MFARVGVGVVVSVGGRLYFPVSVSMFTSVSVSVSICMSVCMSMSVYLFVAVSMFVSLAGVGRKIRGLRVAGYLSPRKHHLTMEMSYWSPLEIIYIYTYTCMYIYTHPT